MLQRIAVILVGLALMSACSQTPRTPSHSHAAIQVVNARVRFLAPDRSELPAGHFPGDVVVIMPYLPGAIFGNPRSGPVLQQRLSGDLAFSLDLHDADAELQRDSAPLTAEWRARGLAIVPADTRLARVGTFAFNARTREQLGANGFIDSRSRDTLILIYVDRACRISGAFQLGREHYHHDIAIPAAGFHWVRVTQPARDSYELRYHPPGGNVDFSIHLLDLQNA